MDTTVRPATAGDLRAIEAMRRRDFDALGWVPMPRWRALVDGTADSRGYRPAVNERLYVATDNDDLTGYLYGSTATTGRIFQCCVRHDARRDARATLLASRFLDDPRLIDRPTVVRVAADLVDAMSFWASLSFEPITLATGCTGRHHTPTGRLLRILERRAQLGV
jgi:hypothetical protein